MVYVFTANGASKAACASLKNLFPKDSGFLTMPPAKHSPSSADISYFDISGLDAAELKSALAKIKKCCENSLWGIIDAKGSVKDPASLFFEGACDYLGPALLKDFKGVDSKRLASVFQRQKEQSDKVVPDKIVPQDLKPAETSAGLINSGVKLPPASAFPGWKKMTAGKTMPFYILFCALQGKIALDTRLGEKLLASVHKRFLSLLASHFKEGDGLLWMDSGKDCLFLIPPKVQCISSVINECISLIASSPQIVLETLGLSIPSNFIFALHYGSISYKPPGKTGTVVSDAVNSIFHLGAKKAEPGRLTITGALPDVTVPKILQDLFISCGEYESRKIWNTKQFKYEKNWL